MDKNFEWAYLVGGANPYEHVSSYVKDPEGKGIHTTNCLYMQNPPVMKYKILCNIIKTIKRVGVELTGGRSITVGATFDSGPEFAKSSFKYKRHNEICLGNDMELAIMVCCYGVLNGDSERYAACFDEI